MPEVTPDATLIIATSWQALSRAETGDERASICNCTVTIVFAALFIEANLNHFIEKASGREGVPTPPDEYAGFHWKLAWVYNSFIAVEPVTDQDQLTLCLEEEFPGFQAIRQFRNSVSHGIIDRSIATLVEARKLRIAAKAIVDRLLSIASENGLDVHRGVEYEMAVNSSAASGAAA